MKIDKVTEALIHGIPTGGATIDQGGRPIVQGIAVGIQPDTCYTCLYKSNRYAHEEITGWLKRIKVEPGACIGIWIDSNGNIVLDIVRVLSTRRFKEAVKLALANKQEAIQLLDPCVTLTLTEC